MPHTMSSNSRLANREAYRENRKAAKKKAAARSRAAKAKMKMARSLPQITEENLLAFQYTHFGDDTKPDKWFMEPEKALHFEPEYEYEEIDDGLGHYEDGVKRTLTDEQIAIFRRTELWQIKRQQERELSELNDASNHDIKEGPLPKQGPSKRRTSSLSSDASSLEDELLSHASISKDKVSELASKRRQASQSTKDSTTSNAGSTWRQRRSKEEVPYAERNKRKWEAYIDSKDPVEGSLTHRRLARELDEQKAEIVEMDY